MVGFIKGLFGGKPQPEKAAPEVEKPQKAEPSSGAYFLPPDDAKTFGNIDYMRTPKSIRRTFPKTAGGEEYAVVKQVSATDGGIISERPGEAAASPAKPEASSAPKPASAPTAAPTVRTSTDTSMDMFRNMAKDIKKR